MSILEVFRSKFPSLSMREAQSLLEQDSSIRLIDVRTPKEYAAGHIPRSRNYRLQGEKSLPFSPHGSWHLHKKTGKAAFPLRPPGKWDTINRGMSGD